MAVDQFLVIDDVKGESTDNKYPESIDVLAWSWGMSQSGSFHHGSGGGAGKASFQDISITKYIDASSPNLMLYCANGKHYGQAQMIIRKAGEGAQEYLKIKLIDVLVTSVSTGGSGGEDRLTENVTLNFAKVEYEYRKQKKDGKLDTAIPFKWDIAGNVKI
jgi:type VI secretion system secreted protein Hcp